MDIVIWLKHHHFNAALDPLADSDRRRGKIVVMNEAVLFVILAPVCAVAGCAMVFAAARFETRRTEFLAKKVRRALPTQTNRAPPAKWRRRTDGERRELKVRFEQVTIAAIVTIVISFVCAAAHAQEAKPCPSDKICPVCIEQDGHRTCKVETPGQLELPQATAPPDISPPSAAAPLPPEYRACITAAANKLPHIATQGIKGSRALPQPQQPRPGVYRVTVEIDVSVAGQSSTYIFNCVRDGRVTVIQPLGMR
jgi:hypothetical protein